MVQDERWEFENEAEGCVFVFVFMFVGCVVLSCVLLCGLKG